MAEFASRGIGNAALTTGIIGTAGWALNGGLQNLLGGVLGNGCNNNCNNNCNNGAAEAAMVTAMATMMAGAASMCRDDHHDHGYDRYDAGKDARIAELETEVKLRDSTIYTDQKSLQLYQYVDGQLRDVREELCKQRVHNQRTEDSFALARQDLMAVKNDLEGQIKMEAERRCCADNAIVNYANATFYPKMVADVTVGTTTTAQTLYNPIPDCGCCGK